MEVKKTAGGRKWVVLIRDEVPLCHPLLMNSLGIKSPPEEEPG